MQRAQKIVPTWLIRSSLAALLIAMGIVVGAEERPTPETTETVSAAEAENASATKPKDPTAAKQALESLRNAGGLQAHIDPQTGSLMVPPLKVRRELSTKVREMISTSHDGLEVFETPFGYSHVDLKGRFHSVSVATVGADGAVTIGHTLPDDLAAETAEAETVSGAGEEQP